MYRSRGCVGCCTKPTPIIAVDVPSKGLKTQGRRVSKPTPSEVFWSTSTYGMDNNGIQSQRSISSLNTSNQTIDSNCAPSSTSATEFVNHGLLRWDQIRQEFLKNSKRYKQTPQVREAKLECYL